MDNQPEGQSPFRGTDRIFIIVFIIFVVLIICFIVYTFYFSKKPSVSITDAVKSYIAKINNASSSPISPEVGNLIGQTKLLWGSGKYQESLTKANEVLQKSTTNQEKSAAHYWIGLSYYHLGDIAQAEQEELLAVQLDPNFEGPYVTLAAVSLNKQDCKQALEYAQKAVDLAPQWAWGYNALGLADICLGNRDKGIVELKKAVQLAPDQYVFQDNPNRVQQQK